MSCGRKIGEFDCCSVVQGDCLELMKQLPDGCVDAVITDPPYGIGFPARPTKRQRRAGMEARAWDDESGDVTNLSRLAPIVVVWGGNYFDLPISRGWLSWRKPDAPPSMGSFELAWTSVDQNPREITQSIAATNAERVDHPTQKPLAVMLWTIEQTAADADVIFDPFAGSGTTLVAAAKLGKHFLGFEIHAEYCAIARARIAAVEAQPTLFQSPAEQLLLETVR